MTSIAPTLKSGRPAAAGARTATFGKSRQWAPYLFLLPGIPLLVVFYLIPIGISIVGALFKENLMGEPVFAGIDNYLGLLRDPAFWNSLWSHAAFQSCGEPAPDRTGTAAGASHLPAGRRRQSVPRCLFRADDGVARRRRDAVAPAA